MHTCSEYLLPLYMTLILEYTDRIVERFKAPALGTSHFGGAGSRPTLVVFLTFLKKLFLLEFRLNIVSITHP